MRESTLFGKQVACGGFLFVRWNVETGWMVLDSKTQKRYAGMHVSRGGVGGEVLDR